MSRRTSSRSSRVRTTVCALSAAALISSVGSSAYATLKTGPGGRGVTVGTSSLIGTVDFSDTFTGTDGGGNPDRPYVAAPQGAPAYIVESTFGKANQRNFTANGGNPPEFSFAGDGPGTPGLVNGNGASQYPGSSGAGSDKGFTQTGGGVDYGLDYGLRTNYIVQVDATQNDDRIDITSAPAPGSIFQGNSISVFFRGQDATDPTHVNNVSLFTLGSGGEFLDTPVRGQPGYENFSTGLAGSRQWHNYAVRFDTVGKKIEIYVDEQSKGIIDLTTFAGGIYQNFSNAAVGAGAGLASGDRTWTDNFQVGSVAVPEPTSLGFIAGGCGAFAMGRRRERR